MKLYRKQVLNILYQVHDSRPTSYFDFFSAMAAWSSTKLDRKQEISVFTKFVGFFGTNEAQRHIGIPLSVVCGVNLSTKMTALAWVTL